jgi:DNA-binding NarL/FixJ family response regulator
VVQAVHEVFNGRPYLSPAMAAQVITKFAHRQAEGEVDAVERLSDRELEILELIGKGNEVRQIAKLLNLSPKTVETHRAHIKDKLDLKNSREVAGLQAGATHRCTSLAVLTAFFVAPKQSVTIDEFSQFLRESS